MPRVPLPDVPATGSPEWRQWAEQVVDDLRRRPRVLVRTVAVLGGDTVDLYPIDESRPPAAVVCLRAVRDDDPSAGVQIAGALTWVWRGSYCEMSAISGLTSGVRYNITFGIVEAL